jgi:hypothetical protein
MALAQHHGLPTVLLDWTRRARFAAYFAATDICMGTCKPPVGTHLAVWALNADAILGAKSVDLGPRPGDGVREGTVLGEYRAPGGTNPNMRTQAGVFTLLSTPDDSSIEQHFARGVVAQGLPSPLHRLMLPHSEAKQLLRLLALEGIDGASMFPGPDGVVKAMRERGAYGPEKVVIKSS